MSAAAVRLAEDLSLPLDVVTETVGILAKRRAGKSYTARKLTEQLLHVGLQVVVVDPKGDWWGLRSSADGKRPGFPILIAGGEHGDVPLEASGGNVLARFVVTERVSLLLDLSSFRKHEVATFMTGFLEALYRLKAREQYRTPVMLVIDEADAIGPQRPQKGEERMLGAAEDIVRRGGQRGIGCTMVTQRAVVLNKNLLTQLSVLVALRPSRHGRVGEPAPVHPHLFRHARVRQIVRHTRSLPLAQKQAGWARLHTEYLTLSDDEACRLMHGVPE